LSSGNGRVALSKATRPDAGVLPIPEFFAIVAAAVVLWYLLGPVVAGVLAATIALSSASLSALFERGDEPSGTSRLALVVSTPTGDRDLHGCWVACCR
jgi:hypothetical protein